MSCKTLSGELLIGHMGSPYKISLAHPVMHSGQELNHGIKLTSTPNQDRYYNCVTFMNSEVNAVIYCTNLYMLQFILNLVGKIQPKQTDPTGELSPLKK